MSDFLIYIQQNKTTLMENAYCASDSIPSPIGKGERMSIGSNMELAVVDACAQIEWCRLVNGYDLLFTPDGETISVKRTVNVSSNYKAVIKNSLSDEEITVDQYIDWLMFFIHNKKERELALYVMPWKLVLDAITPNKKGDQSKVSTGDLVNIYTNNHKDCLLLTERFKFTISQEEASKTWEESLKEFARKQRNCRRIPVKNTNNIFFPEAQGISEVPEVCVMDITLNAEVV